MGNQITSPKVYKQKLQLLQNCQLFFKQKLYKKLDESSYNIFSIIKHDDPDRLRYSQILSKANKLDKKAVFKQLGLGSITNRNIACFLGLAICDAFGASTQFIPFVKDRRDLIQHDFIDIIKQTQCGLLEPRFGKTNVWTDDCSMALCIADSLLLNKFNFSPKHVRYMFHMWLFHGLNNGSRQQSIGLGGNIKISMEQFIKQRQDFTAEKDKFNNGNGSIMRLAPIPICFSGDQFQAIKYAKYQSKTTHNGDEAADCSILLCLILVRLLNRKQNEKWKDVIDKACQDFKPQCMIEIPTVKFLAKSQKQPKQIYQAQQKLYKQKFTKFNKSIEDRNWNWKDPNFNYSKWRYTLNPGYIGSYCMDALSMALHTVWFSNSFKQIALINANMGGDCDTVGAIAGQLAGAIYGIDQYMLHLYSQMQDFKEKRYQIFLKAYKLSTHKCI